MATTTRVLTASVNGTVYTTNANGALEAIDTCHSGATAPTNEVANGKFWLDTTTTPAILKQYNNAVWSVVVNATNVATAGALMDSEVTNLAQVKAFDAAIYPTVANNLSDLSSAGSALTNLGLTATAAELNYTDGVTSAIQTQLDARNAQLTSAWTTGVSTTEGVVSPAKVKSAIEALVNLNAATANSYMVINGLYVQWFSVSMTLDEDLTTAVTFPIAFPTSVFNVFTTTEINSGRSMDAFDVYITSKTTTGAVLRTAAPGGTNYGTGTIHIFAIGN